MHQFGWVRLRYRTSAPAGKVADLESIERLPFGDAMIAATCNWEVCDSNSADLLHSTLRPLFPNWKRSLQLPVAEFQSGQYTLKLSWGNVWRRIVAPAETSLEQLADLILEAYEFDQDHLYQFEFVDRQGEKVHVVCPLIEDAEEFADEIRLGDLPLGAGDEFKFVYDFGDNWEFKLVIEKVGETAAHHAAAAEIIERSGDSPEQYATEDDDGWE